MNDTLIVTVFVVLDDLLRACDHCTDCHARTSDSEVLTVGVIAACQFQNHHERALCVLRGMGYLSGPLSVSRFNRRLHRLAHWFAVLVDRLGEAFAGRALPQGARPGILRLLRGEEGDGCPRILEMTVHGGG